MQKDIETLTTLNHDFVKSVQGADVKRFDEILAKDFLFTNPDGSLYNRAEFLDLIGKGARISELREDQVNVRLFWGLRDHPCANPISVESGHRAHRPIYG